MNGRTRIAFTGAAATMLTALCLWPLMTPTGWLFQAGFLVLVLTGVGQGLRRLATPRPLVPLLQLLVVLLLLNVFYAGDSSLAGVLPDPASVRALGQLLDDGFGDMSQYAAPAPDLPGLTLILVGAVVLIGLVVDTLAITYQRVALAGLPLLALYSVGTGLHPHGGAMWFWFLLAAFGYLALLMAEGHDRLSRWGRVFHGSASTMANSGGGNLLSSAGYRIAAMSVVVGLLLPLGLPSLDTGLLGRFGNGAGIGGNSIITAVNPLASLAASLSKQSNTDVLRYTTSSVNVGDQYLRIVDLDSFNGVAWTTSTHTVQQVPNPLPNPSGLAPGTPAAAVQTRIRTVNGYVQQWLPMPYPAASVLVTGNWRYEPVGRTLVGADPNQTASGLDYTVNSLSVKPSVQQLRAAVTVPDDIRKDYLTLPADFPQVIRDDAATVTKDATNPYDQAVALQNWFTTNGGFRYDTQVKADTGSNAMVQFLRDHAGFCVHFAGTMAAMARSLGIPARVAIGFTPGTKEADGSWLVGTKDAHAWPELYFAGVGWLRFEPTPGRGVAPVYNSAGADAAPSASASADTGTHSSSSAGPKSSSSCDPIQRREGACADQESAGTPAARDQGIGLSPLQLTLVAVGVVLLLLLLTPMLWRFRARRGRLRRRGSRGGPGELSEQQVLAAWRELIDSAWDIGIPPNEAETPRRTVARIVELGELDEEPRAAAGRLALATEQVLYAPRVELHPALRQDVRLVRSGLRASVGRSVRLRAVLFPPSAARIAEGLRDRRRAAGAALRRAFRRRG